MRGNLRSVSPYFVVTATKTKEQHPRLAIALAKKKIAKAVWRNRLRRQIKETFRAYQHALKDLDIMVVSKKREDWKCVEKHTLALDLANHWERLIALRQKA